MNVLFLREKMGQILSASKTERKTALSSMATSNGNFVFDGRSVCGEFLRTAFRFSLESQVVARRQPIDETIGINHSVIESIQSINAERNASSVEYVTMDSSGSALSPPALDSIITFIDRLVESTADRMPDNGEFHLPFFRKTEVYDIFKREFSKLYPSRDLPSNCYFLSVWKRHRSLVKVRKQSRFTKCSTCERLRSEIANAIRKGLPTDALKREQGAHLHFIAKERQEYLRKAELAMLRPTKYLSFVVDGADQSTYDLPHFTTKTKQSQGDGLKVHLIGLLQHMSMNRLNLYTMTSDHETGSNHIVEVIHRFINNAANESTLPRHAFIQLDNCIRENKNHYLLSYLDALVRWNVFDCVEVGFLPIDHTHCDVDQCFSTTSDRLKYNDAITLSDLQNVVASCYNEKTTVTNLKQLINWSGLCDKSKCYNVVNQITQYRFFKFTRRSIGAEQQEGQQLLSECHVRSSCVEDWRSLESDNKTGVKTILKFVPELSTTPPERVSCPSGLEEFEKKLDSERARIVTEVKMRSLVALKNQVFRDKSLNFHWNLSSIVETRNISGESDEVTPETVDRNVGEVTSNSLFSYALNSFVAVNTGGNRMDGGFWIGKVVEVHRGKQQRINTISVHWFEFYGSTNMYTGRYKPHLLSNGSSKKGTPWIYRISTETVLVSFPRLTSDKRLPSAVSKHLREHFSASYCT